MSRYAVKRKDEELSDSRARDAIVKDLDRTIMVEAGAGSGKTTSMVRRMVELIAEGKATIEGMAAVTFTRKAAAELKERFQIGLEEEFKRSSGARKENVATALESLEQGFAGTIHSFCGRLLRERPVEAGIDPAFTEMDEIETLLMQEEIWEQYLLQTLGSHEKVMKSLYDLEVTLGNLREAYHMLVLYPEVSVISQKTHPPDITEAIRALREIISYVDRRLPASVPDDGWDELQSAVADAAGMMAAFGAEDRRDFFRVLSLFDKDHNQTKKRWPTKTAAEEAKARVSDFRDRVVVPMLNSWRQYRHAHLMDIVKPAAELCARRRKERSLLDYQDLLLGASRLLRESPEVRAYFRRRYSHLLVDEFQDTDPVQAEVMLYLTGVDIHEKDWQKLNPAQGSLFVVGDPKQSIYRFRRADIDIYNTVREIIKSSGGEVVDLTNNFRSVKSICEWVNSVFKGRFPVGGSQFQAPSSELAAVRDEYPSMAAGVRKITIAKKRYNSQDAIVEDDARRIATWMRHALDGGIKLERTAEEKKRGLTERPVPSDFMILLRNKKQISAYAEALEEFEIPFEVSGGNTLKGATGFREVVKIMKAVADPGSPVDMVASLRGMFFGVSDDTLYRFRRAGGRFSFLSALPDKVDSDVEEVLGAAYGRLKKYREWSITLPPAVCVEKIIEDVGLVPWLLSRDMGGSQTGSLMKVMEALESMGGEGQADFMSLVEELDALLTEGEMDEIDIMHGAIEAVRIMNLHKAKGLEAPVIFLANPSGKSNHGPRLHIQRKGDKAAGYFAVGFTDNYGNYNLIATPPSWDTLEGIEMQYSSSEEDRLLYVAATRAKNLLVVSAYPDKPEKNPWSSFDHYLNGVEELEARPEQPEKSQDILKVTKNYLGDALSVIGTKLEKMGARTYNTETVTSLTKEINLLPPWKKTGLGLSWGNVMHRALEGVGRGLTGNDLAVLVTNILISEGRSPDERDNVLALIKSITESDFWKEVSEADEKFLEVPFSLKVKPSDVGLEESAGNFVILSGAIDLAYKKDGAWTVVDYKTDDVGDNLDKFSNYYAPQVREYARYWEKMSGEKISKAGLFFVTTNRFVAVAV